MNKYSTPICELLRIDTEEIMLASYESYREANNIGNGDLDKDSNYDCINWQK